MGYVLWGLAGFGLCLVYDVNQVRWHSRAMRSCFSLGCILLLATTGWTLWRSATAGAARWLAGGWPIAFLALAGAAFVVLLYTLFFALPFSDTYVSQQANRVCDRGMYALCRHPGVLWLTLTYLFLAIAWGSGQVWRLGIWYSCLNLGYVWFQDRWTFPQTFSDYSAYRKQTPFLIPTAKSIKRAWLTRR